MWKSISSPKNTIGSHNSFHFFEKIKEKTRRNDTHHMFLPIRIESQPKRVSKKEARVKLYRFAIFTLILRIWRLTNGKMQPIRSFLHFPCSFPSQRHFTHFTAPVLSAKKASCQLPKYMIYLLQTSRKGEQAHEQSQSYSSYLLYFLALPLHFIYRFILLFWFD